MNILLVDDDQDNLECLCEYVRFSFGFKCSTASSLSQAMEMVKSDTYDLIFLDLMIHGSQSTPFIKWVKETYPDNTPAICLVSAARGLDKIAQDSSADYFLNKPYDIEILNEYLQRKKDTLENTVFR